MKKISATALVKSLLLIILCIAGAHAIPQSIAYYYNHGIIDLAAFFAVWILTVSALVVLALSDSTVLRITAGFLVMVFSFTLDLHFSALHESITIDSLMSLWKERAAAGEAFNQYWRPGLLPFIRSVLMFIVILWPARYIKTAKAAAAVLACAVIVFAQSISLMARPSGIGVDGIPGHLSGGGVFLALAYLDITTDDPSREKVSLPVISKPAIKNIILIVDESIRADYIDLNRKHDTTPYLVSIRDRIINFGFSTSGTNNSSGSNCFLRMGAVPRQLMSKEGRRLFEKPFIWDYAHNASYRTAFVDCQRCGKYQNYMTETERCQIDYFIQIPQDDERYVDHMAVAKIRELMEKEKGPLFIYINKKGAHFHYEEKYPPEAKRFTPALALGEPITDRNRLLNSYRNVVRWNVNDFFRELLNNLSLSETVILYTSDHGQNLMDDGTTVTHYRFKNAIPQEVIVPLMVFTDNAEMKKLFRKGLNTNMNRASQFQLFPTILTLFGYDHEAVVKSYYPALMDPVEDGPAFFTGNVRYGRLRPIYVDNPLSWYMDGNITGVHEAPPVQRTMQ